MATYLPNITDIFPQPVNFQPDFNFFDKMLQRKQALYDQGVAKAKSAFDNVLYAPLSDKANIPLRDEYIKKAKEQLKNISGADFSLPENIAAAQNIFTPFWNDDLMLKDTNITKWYQSQAQKLVSWRDDNDPKTKEQYNGIAMMYLNNGLEKLQNANRDPNVYAKVEKREAIPFTNIQSWLEEQAGKEPDKLKVVWDEQSPDGGYLVSTVNGERSKKKFSTWAESKIGNNFFEQFKVTGIVEKEQRIKDLKKTMPNLTDDQALQIMSKDVVTELDEGYKKRKNSNDVEIANINGILKAMPPILDENNKALVDKLRGDLALLNGKQGALDEEYKYFNQTTRDKVMQAVLTNPDNYFGTLAKQRLIDNWATGRASIESRDIKENTAWFSAQNLQMRKAEFNRNVKNDEWQRQKDIWEQQNKIWEQQHPKTTTGTKTTTVTTDANGNVVTTTADGEDVTSTGRYIGLGTTGDITATAITAGEVYNRRMNDLYLSAHDMIFDPSGLLYVTKAGLNLTDAEVASISSALKNEVRSIHDPNSPDYDFTPEQKTAVNKLTKALEADPSVQAAGIKMKGPSGLRDAIIAYGQSYFNKRLEISKDGNDVPLNQNEFGAMMSYLTSVQNLDIYNANEANRQELLKKILKDPEYKSIVVDHNGQKEIITASDMVKDMPTLEFKELGNPKAAVLKMTKEDVARRFINGELSQTEQGDMFIDGIKYALIKTNNEEGIIYGPRAWNTYYNDVLVPKYGTSEDFANKVKQANEKVVPDLLFYKDRTGRLGSEFSYTFDKKHQEDKAFNIFNEALSPANADIYGSDGKPITDTSIMEALRALLQNKEENIEKYIQGFTYKTLGVDGKQTISFNIGEISSETKQQIGGVNLDKLNNQQYSLVISPTATGPTLTSLPNSTGMYVYQNLLRGKPMKCDAIIAASGFDFTLTPNTDGSTGAGGQTNTPTNVRLNLKYNVRENVTNPTTKILTSVIKQKSQDVDIPLVGANSKSPDEIVNYLYKLYYDTMVANRNTQQQYEQYLQSSSNNGAINPINNQPVTYDRDKYYRDNGIIIK